MTKAAIDFNLRYNLNITPSAFETVKNKSVANELSGKPKKNITQVLKRFVQNPYALGAAIVFLAIILCSIIIPYTSHYSPDKDVRQYTSNAISDLIKNRHGYGVVTEFVSKQTYDKLLLVNSAAFRADPLNAHAPQAAYQLISSYPALDQYLVKYNPWDLVSIFDNKPIMDASGKVIGFDYFTAHNSIVGTSEVGIDIWTRTWSGTWSSLKLAIITVTITTTIGVLIGGWIGMYAGSVIDIIFMKILSLYTSIPALFWYIFVASLLPAGFGSLLVTFVITSWMSTVGITRIYMWRYVNSDFMKVAQTLGVSQFGRIIRHALPNFLGIILLSFVSSIPAIIEGEATLGFLGLSPNPNGASLGNVLSEMQSTLSGGYVDNVWYLLLPTMIIFTITMSLHFVAVGLSDAVDPKFRKG